MDAMERLATQNLSRAESDLKALGKMRRRKTQMKEFTDVRAVIHCHSHLSHDSTGSIDDIAAAANSTKTSIVMINDHPRDDLDVIADGFSGKRSNVTFLPGAEARNLLIYSAENLDFSQTQRDLIRDVRKKNGTAFLSHLENQEAWDLDGINGTEIYNLHASFLSQGMLSTLFKPTTSGEMRRLIDILLRLRAHPRAGFASLCDVPHYYLSCWDNLCRSSLITGLAANDSHANYTITIKRITSGISIRDADQKEIASLPAGPHISKQLPKGELVLTPDSYEVSFQHVGTHLLLKRQDKEGIIECLRQGHCYVGFDWIVDSHGFSFTWEGKGGSGFMGDKTSLAERPVLMANLPLPANLILLRNGRIIRRLRSSELEYRPEAPGIYRAEAYLNVAGEERPWIFSNPIQVCV